MPVINIGIENRARNPYAQNDWGFDISFRKKSLIKIKFVLSTFHVIDVLILSKLPINPLYVAK